MTQPLLLFGSLFDCWMSASLTGAISAESSFFFSFCKFNNFLFLTSCPPYKCKNKRKTMEPARSWTRLSSRESARAAYIGRTALVPICQCPRQEMSLLKIVCNWGGGGVTWTMSELPKLRQYLSQILSGWPPCQQIIFSTLILSTSHNIQLETG